MHFLTILTALAATAAAAPAVNSRDVSAARRERFLARHHARAGIASNVTATGQSHPHIPATYNGQSQGPKKFIKTAYGEGEYDTDYSGNWCGAVQKSPPAGQGQFTTLQATWTMPTLQRPPGASGSGTWYGSQWVGIDGYTYGNAILQAGTTSAVTVDDDGNSYNSASSWFEWYPNPETEMSFEVNPGDTIYVIITAFDSTDGQVYMKNQNTGNEVVQPFSAPSGHGIAGDNAEWIYEDFSAGGLVPFAQFSPVTFSGANAGTQNGGTNLNGATIIDMVSNNQIVCQGNILDATDLQVTY